MLLSTSDFGNELTLEQRRNLNLPLLSQLVIKPFAHLICTVESINLHEW